ncbi:MAG: 4Fe-4S binding protein [Bacillota bacterium]
MSNPQGEFTVAFSEACNGCGLCVKHCPYEALARKDVNKR